MKWYHSERLRLLAVFLLPWWPAVGGASALHHHTPADSADTAFSQADTVKADSLPGRYERHVAHYRKGWNRLIPSHYVFQYAGSIGIVSFGAGWHYGRDHWETELLLGIVPRYNSDATKMTLTVRQRYIPWHLPVGRRWVVEPFTTGVFFSSIFGEDFWANEPSRYPKHYYGFSTKIRANVFVGQRIKFNIPRRRRIAHKSVSLFYELGTSDLYIITAATNRAIRLRDILSLAIGARFEVL